MISQEIIKALESNNVTLHMLWDLVADSDDEELIREQVQAQIDLNNGLLAKEKRGNNG